MQRINSYLKKYRSPSHSFSDKMRRNQTFLIKGLFLTTAKPINAPGTLGSIVIRRAMLK